MKHRERKGREKEEEKKEGVEIVLLCPGASVKCWAKSPARCNPFVSCFTPQPSWWNGIKQAHPPNPPPPPRHPLKKKKKPTNNPPVVGSRICLDCYDQWMVAMTFSDIFLHKKESFADRWHVPRCVGTGRPSQIVSVSRAGWKPEVGVSSPGTTVSLSPLPTPPTSFQYPPTPPHVFFQTKPSCDQCTSCGFCAMQHDFALCMLWAHPVCCVVCLVKPLTFVWKVKKSNNEIKSRHACLEDTTVSYKYWLRLNSMS